MSDTSRIALVIDALCAYRGAERVLAAVLELYPKASIYTLVHEPAAFAHTAIAGREVHTSFMQRVPGGTVHYRSFLPLLPLAIEHLDVRGCDTVLSFSYAVAHGVRCTPDQLHISYTFAPLRYAWQDADEYFRRGIVSPLARLTWHYFRVWDRKAVGGVDHFAAISQWTASCIRRAYRRESEVIHPPVELERFKPSTPRGDYFLAFSRLVRHKRVELIVKAFSALELPLIVIGDGAERERLKRMAAPNVKLVGQQGNEQAAEWLGRARALVHAAKEDFGLVMAEAQAAGCPVIAYGGGAAPEIVVEGRTGVLFSTQTVESLMEGVGRFVQTEQHFQSEDCCDNARRFSKARFQKTFGDMVERERSNFRRA